MICSVAVVNKSYKKTKTNNVLVYFLVSRVNSVFVFLF